MSHSITLWRMLLRTSAWTQRLITKRGTHQCPKSFGTEVAVYRYTQMEVQTERGILAPVARTGRGDFPPHTDCLIASLPHLSFLYTFVIWGGDRGWGWGWGPNMSPSSHPSLGSFSLPSLNRSLPASWGYGTGGGLEFALIVSGS